MVWLIIAAVVAGLTVAILVLVFADTGIHPAARMARCSMGFFVAIVWIMAIADEVVQVLQVSSTIVLGAGCSLTSSITDLWLHLRFIRCNHWFNDIRCWKFFGRSRCKYERCCRCESILNKPSY